MMTIGARSYENGIDFFNCSIGTTTKARRNISGKITITGGKRKFEFKKNNNFKLIFICILFSYLFSICSSFASKVIVIIAFAWFITFTHYISNHINNKNKRVFQLLVISEPSHEELEVAIRGLEKSIKQNNK